MIDLGADYPASFAVRDGNGNPANAETVTLTFTLPDATTDTPDVANPPAVTGSYRYAYPTAQEGRHVVRWTSANPDCAWTDVFDVSAAASPSILSLFDAKVRLGIDLADTTDDAELRAKLAGLTRALERAKNESIARRSVTQTGMHARHEPLRLLRPPVISLDALTGETEAGTTTYDVGNFRVDAESGLVHRLAGPRPFGWVTSVYTAGHAVIPEHYIEGASVLLQHLWETRRGAGTVGAGDIGPEEADDWKQMTMLPRKVLEWIGPARPIVFLGAPMAWQSTQPAALAALVAMFTAATAPGCALAGVHIADGPIVSSSSALEWLLAGWSGERMSTKGTYPEPEGPEIAGSLAIEGLSAARSREKYTITNTVEVVRGASDGLVPARERAYAIVSACAGLIAANPRLGRTVMLATVGATSYTPSMGPRGAKASVRFGVDIDAFTNP